MDLKRWSTIYSLLLIYLASVIGFRKFRRVKRDDDDDDDESKENYLLPPYISSNPFPSGNHPFPNRKSSDMYPQFPFTHQFSNGFDVNPGNIAYINGGLNIPDPSTGQVFDFHGRLLAGPSHTWLNYGHLIQPVNTLKTSPETMERMINDPEFQAARRTAPIVPVAQLPSAWRPIHCKPPICNPFVHTVDVGVQVEPGDDGWFDGGIDFPILRGEYAGKRFPLSGAMYAGTQPIYFVYGHHLNPVNPFKGVVSKPGQTLGGSPSQQSNVPFRPFDNQPNGQPPAQGPSPSLPVVPNGNGSPMVLPPDVHEPQREAPFSRNSRTRPLPPLPPGH